MKSTRLHLDTSLARVDEDSKLQIDSTTITQPSLYMALLSRVKTELSINSIKRLAVTIHANAKPPSKAYIYALAATVCDLLRASAYQPVRSCFRPMASGSFSNCPIGYKVFTRVLDDLTANGFVDVMKGCRGFKGNRGYVTRIRTTPLMIEQLLKDGLTPKNVAYHFTCPPLMPPAATECPIKLKGSSYSIKGKKRPAADIHVDRNDATFRDLCADMVSINEFLAKHHLSLGENDSSSYFSGLQRIFHLGDKANFRWNRSGRLYGYGRCYQSLPKKDRKLLTIDKEKVVEVDISACFITILHSIKHLPLPDRSDLYDGVGVPRDIMKDYVNATLGGSRFLGRWTKDHKEKHGSDLQLRFPVNKMKEKSVKLLPVLDGWGTEEICWADLHYIESNIILATMTTLMGDHGIPCFPVHDSIVVPASKAELAKQCLSRSFAEFTGLIPTLKIN